MAATHRRGFTLVELLVVISILAILAGLAVSGLMVFRKKAAISATSSRIQLLGGALAQYQNAFGDYPPTSFSDRRHGGGLATNGVNDGVEALVRCLSTSEGGGPFITFDADMLTNTDADQLESDPCRSYMATLEAFEVADHWKQPLVYIHHRDYEEPGRAGLIQLRANAVETISMAVMNPSTKAFENFDTFQIWSLGPDGKNDHGAGDDIGNW